MFFWCNPSKSKTQKNVWVYKYFAVWHVIDTRKVKISKHNKTDARAYTRVCACDIRICIYTFAKMRIQTNNNQTTIHMCVHHMPYQLYLQPHICKNCANTKTTKLMWDPLKHMCWSHTPHISNHGCNPTNCMFNS